MQIDFAAEDVGVSAFLYALRGIARTSSAEGSTPVTGGVVLDRRRRVMAALCAMQLMTGGSLNDAS